MNAVNNPFPEFQGARRAHRGQLFRKSSRAKDLPSACRQLERSPKQERLRQPLPITKQRLSDEIEMIKKMRFAGYFLIVWDFIRYARAQGIPVGPGRGSAAGSLVSYALRITDVDPLQYDLLFERFLNPERVSHARYRYRFLHAPPRRSDRIRHRKSTARENVAQIITFGTMAAKAALKDVGRALDMPYGEVDRLAKLIPNQAQYHTRRSARSNRRSSRSAIEADERVKDLLEIAQRLEGLARHASTHAAGVVISPQPLTDIVPLYKTNRDEITTQYDMKAPRAPRPAEDGFPRPHHAHRSRRRREADRRRIAASSIDLATLPLDDAPTYELFARGDTTAIFQFESHGMRDILRRYQPTRLEDLTALNALYRPGPIQGGMIDDFIDRKHGKKKVTYDLPELKDILEETYGVILYQEQVMQIANRLAGFSLGEADILRRAMGKKKPEEMAAQREKFLAGCAARKVPPKKAEKIFDLMAEFAGYGFNKSHSCAYALLAYQTAYLKTHYPVEFMAALLTSETGNTEKVVKYIHEARGMGITVLPPDVNSSDLNFTPVGEADSLRPGGHQECRRKYRARHPRSARQARTLQVDLPISATRRSAPAEPARARKPDQSPAPWILSAHARATLRCHRRRHGARPETRSAIAKPAGQHGLFGGGRLPSELPERRASRMPRSGPNVIASPANSPRWAFTSPAIRSINMPAASRN